MRSRHSTYRALVALFALALMAPALAQQPASAIKLPAPAKFAVYLLGQRAGKATMTFQQSTLAGKPAIRMDADTVIKVEALGEVEQTIRIRQYLSPAGDPLYQRTEVAALGRPTTILAKFHPDRVECDITAGGQKSKKTVPIPKGIKLVGDKDFANATSQLKVGQKETYHYFEPTGLRILKVTMEVLREEKITIAERAFDAFVLKSLDQATGESLSWVTKAGDLLQTESKTVPLKMVREDFGTLPQAYSPPQDFLAATSVKTATKIADPRAVRLLRVKITGVPDRELVLSDERQKATVEGEGENLAVTYELRAADPPERAAPVLAKREGEPMLQDAPYLGVDDPEIQKQAQAIAGDEKDRAVIARRLRDWVNKHMEKAGNAGILRSAKEIMANRDGVCREFATLYTALARAAGIPTRMCGGVLYHEGAFYYHAWVECRLTDDPNGWVTFDPTLKTDFVDATHIKFTQGDVTDMFGATRVVGHLKAEILEYR